VRPMPSVRYLLLHARLRIARALERDETGLLPLRLAAILILLVVPLLGSCLKAAPQKAHDQPLVTTPLNPEDAVIDLAPDAGVGTRRGIPPKPEPWQKKPPCPKEMGERAINGACYFRIHPEDMKPPCKSPALEHGEFCWRAVAQVNRDPTSITPSQRR